MDASSDSAKVAMSLAGLGYVSVAAFIFNIILTRSLSVANYGHIGVVRTVLDMLLVPAGLGMGACIAKHVADGREGPLDRARMLSTAMAICFVSSIVTTVVAFGGLMFPAVLPDPVALGILRWMVFLTPFVALFACVTGFLQGIGNIRRLVQAMATRSTIRVGLGVVLVLAYGFTGWKATRVAVEILALVFVLPAVFHLFRYRPDAARLRPFLRFGGYTAATLALSTLLAGIDILCLVHFRGDAEEIAYYKVATLMFTTALLLPNAYIQARYSKMVAEGYDGAKTWRNYTRHAGYLLGLIVPAALIAYIVAGLIPWLFGGDYAPSVGFFRWLLPAYIIQSIGKLSSNLVAGAGLIRAQFLTSGATLGANAVINVMLIPKYGVAGAIVATTASFVLKGVISTAILWRYKSLGAGKAGDA